VWNQVAAAWNHLNSTRNQAAARWNQPDSTRNSVGARWNLCDSSRNQVAARWNQLAAKLKNLSRVRIFAYIFYIAVETIAENLW
jgi:hypothetical protein